MEQEPSGGAPKSESSTKEEGASEGAQMPEHPGRDSDSEGSGAEQEQ